MAKPSENDGEQTAKLRANSVPRVRDIETGEPSSTKAITVLKPKTRARREATGPRTAIGKKRSSRNALKYGIFSKGLLVGDESSDEFALSVQGLHNDWQPEGTLETVLVRN